MKEKLLLIQPHWYIYREYIEDQRKVPIPLGILYIGAIAEKVGYDVKLLDVLAEGWDNVNIDETYSRYGLSDYEIKRRIKEYNPDIVGVSCMSSQARSGHEIAALVKSINKNIKVIIGGAYPTHEKITDRNIDIFVRGDGETYFKEYKTIDSIPFPAWHLLNFKKYIESSKKGLGSRFQNTELCMPVITSRGCPYNCIYCSIKSKWRARNPENVANEIEQLVKIGIKNIEFEDDSINVNMDRFKGIMKEIIHRNLKIKWSSLNGLRGDLLDKEAIILMKKSGCRLVRFGVENGNQEFLNKVIKKNLNLEKVAENIKLCIKHGIEVEGNFMFGIPGETKEIMEDTVSCIKRFTKLGMNCLSNIATPFPNTDMHKICLENNYLTKPVDWEVLQGIKLRGIIKTNDFTPEDAEFYLRKARYTAFMETIAANPFRLLKTNFGKLMFKSPKLFILAIKRGINILKGGLNNE